MRTEEFLVDLDEGMLDYFRETADETLSRFGISRPEAVARINASFEGMDGQSPYGGGPGQVGHVIATEPAPGGVRHD